MTADQIYYVAIARFYDHYTVYECNLNTSITSRNVDGIQTALRNHPNSSFYRTFTMLDNAKAYSIYGSRECIYLVLCHPSVAERHAYAFLDAVGNAFANQYTFEYIRDTTKALSFLTKNDVLVWWQRSVTDRLTTVMQKVEGVKDVMKENIKKAIDNHQVTLELEERTFQLQQNSRAFQRNAREVRKQMWWRDFKVKAIIACIVIAVLLAVLVPIIINASS